MKNTPFLKFNKKAITLMEIIVASVIALIVLSSLASVDYSVRMMYKNRTPKTMLGIETSAALQHIARNIQAATGDGSDLGVDVVGGNTLSIRQDKQNPQTPGNYTDDAWVFYDLDAASNSIRFCNRAGGACSLPPLTTLAPGRVKSFSVSFIHDNTIGALDNQVAIKIESCVEPSTCVTPDFTAQTTVSVPSVGQSL